MNKQYLRFTLYAIIVYLAGGTLNPAIAATQLSGGNGTHFCGVIDDQSDKRPPDQFPNRHYARTVAPNWDVGEPRTVRLIYFTPNDRPYRADVVRRMKDKIHSLQTFYAEQMGAHGYGNKTFRVETDPQGEPIVHWVDGRHPDSHYLDDTAFTVYNELEEAFNLFVNIYFIVIDNSINRIGRGDRRFNGFANRRGKNGGFALVRGDFGRALGAHELGHTFGLRHDFSDSTYIMSYGPGRNRLSVYHADYLSVHPYFNPDTPIEKGPPSTIELISSHVYPAGSRSVPVRLKVSDSEGVHQVFLFVRAIEPHIAAGQFEVKAWRGLAGDTDPVVEFDYDGVIPSDGSTNLSNPVVHPISVEAVDMNGNVRRTDFVLFSKTVQPLSKISGDNQHGLPNALLPIPFVVEVRDLKDGFARREVSVTFAVTAGSGTLSVTRATTDKYGRAESTLTLGPNLGTNTVEVSAAGIEPPVTFNAVTEAAVDIPDSNLRAAIETTLSKAEGELIAPAEMATLTGLSARDTSISDLTGLEFATNLTELRLERNSISDLSPLVANTGLGNGDTVDVRGNSLNYLSIHTHIPTLQNRGVTVEFDDLTEYLLSIPAGISLIHVPLKVTTVDGVAGAIESIADLYDALGGEDTVNFLITHDPKTQGWRSYLGESSRGSAGDKVLTDDTGILAVMTQAVSVSLRGDALGTNGSSSITLHPGTNLVGVPLRDSRIARVSDLFALDGIEDNVSAIIVSDNGAFKVVGRAGDAGDIEITGGQSFILIVQRAATAAISGDGWTNISGEAAAPPVSLTGIEVGDVTPVLALTGSIVSPIGGWGRMPHLRSRSGFRVIVKNLSTGRAVSRERRSAFPTATGDEKAGYRLIVVDIETGRAAQIGDILEISVRSPSLLIGVEPLRYTITAEDVRQSRIQLPALVAYEIPTETELLPNYPNPFNPETWIPYRLAEDAFVTLTIYDLSGHVIRTLDVGHRIAAVYEDRSKAIYWDGKNGLGERVTSGIYFYTLTAGDYSATRKMVILNHAEDGASSSSTRRRGKILPRPLKPETLGASKAPPPAIFMRLSNWVAIKPKSFTAREINTLQLALYGRRDIMIAGFAGRKR